MTKKIQQLWIFFQSFDWLLTLGSSSQIKISNLFSEALLPLQKQNNYRHSCKVFSPKVVKQGPNWDLGFSD